jgi:transposase
MGRPYSQDLRERVMAAVDGGMRVYAAAPVFRVSVSYIYKALGRRTKTGETTARTGRAGRKAKLAPHDEALCTQIGEHPDATLAELKTWLASARQIEVSTGCLWNRLRRLHLPLKKSLSALPSRTGPMLQKRARFGVASKPN